MKNILLLGSGGRECALAWKLSQSALCGTFFIAPGNAGTSEYGVNLPISYNDFEAIKRACLEYKIDIVIPGPEDPLVLGIWDFFKNDPKLKHIIVAGPSKEGAQLEGSKAFSKKFMGRHNIPTADYKEFSAESFEQGVAYIKRNDGPIVIKADGLAAGKGVVIAPNKVEGVKAFRSMVMDKQFGEASNKVVIEQFLDGIELSVFVLTDGENYILLPEAKDYKRIGEGDTGPNTGGMGAYSPLPWAPDDIVDETYEKVLAPMIAEMAARGTPFVGLLYAGLALTNSGIKVIEFNARFGDPETEVLIPRLVTPLAQLLYKAATDSLDDVALQWSDESAVTVVLASEGYPESPKTKTY